MLVTGSSDTETAVEIKIWAEQQVLFLPSIPDYCTESSQGGTATRDSFYLESIV